MDTCHLCGLETSELDAHSRRAHDQPATSAPPTPTGQTLGTILEAAAAAAGATPHDLRPTTHPDGREIGGYL